MLSPFYTTIDLNQSKIRSVSESDISNDVTIPEKYFNNFPYLIKYQINPTDNTHFETLLLIIRDLFTNEKKKNDPELKKLFQLFVRTMPKYKHQLNFKLSTKIIETMATKCPEQVSLLYSKNPGIFPSSINSPLFEIIREVNNIDGQNDEYSANRLFAQITSSINSNTAQHYISLFASIISHKNILDMTTPAMASFIEKAIKIAPSLLFSSNFPESTEIIQNLTPISLISSRDRVPNAEIVASLNLCHYAYNLITSSNLSENLQNALNLHRFINSGSAAVDAMALSISCYPEFFDTLKTSRQGFYTIISACLACVISSVELPSVKDLIQKCSIQICDLFIKQIDSTTDSDAASLYLIIVGSIFGSEYTPLTILFQNWLGNHIPMMYIAMSLSYDDEMFVPFVTECASEIAKDNHLVCDITRKLLCTGPSPAARYAIRQLAFKVNSKLLLSYLVECNPILFVPGLYLISTANQKININDSNLGKSFLQIVLNCVSSESVFAIHSLEYFANMVVDLPDNLHIQLITKLVQKADSRSFLRFLLMITSVQNFSKFMTKNANVASSFLQRLASIVRPTKNIAEISTVAISWRNMCINFQNIEVFQQKNIFELFNFGTTAIIAWAGSGMATELITSAICDVLSNAVVRPFLIEKVRSCMKNTKEWDLARKAIVKTLAGINAADVMINFPSVKEYENLPVPQLPQYMWKRNGWVNFMTGRVIVISK